MFLHQIYRFSRHVCDLFPECDGAAALPSCADLLKTGGARGPWKGRGWGGGAALDSQVHLEL